MKHVEQQTRAVEVVASVECDLCGEARPANVTHAGGSDEIVTVKHEISHSLGYDGGGRGRTLELDICPKCFREKVLPALRSMGLKREYEEYDW